jgi:hypothetical protein
MSRRQDRGKFVGFYGFKGGSGRSLTLANLAVLLAESGKEVLVIDLDLEAPGLSDYLERYVRIYFPRQALAQREAGPWRQRYGWLDLVRDRQEVGTEQPELDLRGLLTERRLLRPAEAPDVLKLGFEREGPFCAYTSNNGGAVFLMGPGRNPDGDRYQVDVLNADWPLRFRDGLLRLTDGLRTLLQDWDGLVLFDLRTGLSQLSWQMHARVLDQLVMVSPATHQGAQGIAAACGLFAVAGQRRPVRSYLAISGLHGATPDPLQPGAPEVLMQLGLWSLFVQEAPDAARGRFEDRLFHFPRVRSMAGRERLLFEPPEKADAGMDDGPARTAYLGTLEALARALLEGSETAVSRQPIQSFRDLAADAKPAAEREAEGKAGLPVVRSILTAIGNALRPPAAEEPAQAGRKADVAAIKLQPIEKLLTMLRTGSGDVEVEHYGAREALGHRLAHPWLCYLAATGRLPGAGHPDDPFAALGLKRLKLQKARALAEEQRAFLETLPDSEALVKLWPDELVVDGPRLVDWDAAMALERPRLPDGEAVRINELIEAARTAAGSGQKETETVAALRDALRNAGLAKEARALLCDALAYLALFQEDWLAAANWLVEADKVAPADEALPNAYWPTVTERTARIGADLFDATLEWLEAAAMAAVAKKTVQELDLGPLLGIAAHLGTRPPSGHLAGVAARLAALPAAWAEPLMALRGALEADLAPVPKIAGADVLDRLFLLWLQAPAPAALREALAAERLDPGRVARLALGDGGSGPSAARPMDGERLATLGQWHWGSGQPSQGLAMIRAGLQAMHRSGLRMQGWQGVGEAIGTLGFQLHECGASREAALTLRLALDELPARADEAEADSSGVRRARLRRALEDRLALAEARADLMGGEAAEEARLDAGRVEMTGRSRWALLALIERRLRAGEDDAARQETRRLADVYLQLMASLAVLDRRHSAWQRAQRAVLLAGEAAQAAGDRAAAGPHLELAVAMVARQPADLMLVMQGEEAQLRLAMLAGGDVGQACTAFDAAVEAWLDFSVPDGLPRTAAAGNSVRRRADALLAQAKPAA